MKRNPFAFVFADPARHGGRGDSMGRPAKTAADADRQGRVNLRATDGFYREATPASRRAARAAEGDGRRFRWGRRT